MLTHGTAVGLSNVLVIDKTGPSKLLSISRRAVLPAPFAGVPWSRANEQIVARTRLANRLRTSIHAEFPGAIRQIFVAHGKS